MAICMRTTKYYIFILLSNYTQIDLNYSSMATILHNNYCCFWVDNWLNKFYKSKLSGIVNLQDIFNLPSLYIKSGFDVSACNTHKYDCSSPLRRTSQVQQCSPPPNEAALRIDTYEKRLRTVGPFCEFLYVYLEWYIHLGRVLAFYGEAVVITHWYASIQR